MAKISRRAVASSSVSSSSPSASATSATASVNNIAAFNKPGRNVPSDSASKFNSGNPTVDPLRHTSAKPYTTRSFGENSSATGASGMDKAGVMHPTITALPPPSYTNNKTIEAELLAAERDRIRAEFFATYDVMTGVRIAATLSGFFGLMVFLIVWKSRSSSNETLKVLKDPKMAAVAAVCMQEEEEREIQEAMVATGMSIYPDEYDAIIYRRQRMLSLGNVSAPPMLNRGFRFSSVGGGGYSSLLEPPRRFSYSAISGVGPSGVGSTNLIAGRRKSGSEFGSRILSNYPMGSSFGTDDYFVETEDELDNVDYPLSSYQPAGISAQHKRTDSTKSKQGFLEVPLMGQDSRRSSAMTCCSTDSSYLERRCSAFTLGLSNLPTSLQRKLSTASRTSSTDNWDYYYPDIQVIQPTPKPTPCPSERSLFEQLQGNQFAPNTTTITSITTQSNAKFSTITTTTTTAAATNTATQPTTNKTAKSSHGPGNAGPSFVRKHSIAYYDPQSAHAGRKQQIHSISADTVNVYPYNQSGIAPTATPIQSAPPAGVHNVFHFTESPTEELYLNVRRKVTVVELQQTPREDSHIEEALGSRREPCENNNILTYANSAKIAYTTSTAAVANSSSISVDSTPVSIDKLNGTVCSLGTISGKALFNAEKRAPLASLSSFKISSLEIQDSEMRSLDDDSVFLDSVADTDEDMQQLSSDSDEESLAAAQASGQLVGVSATADQVARPNRGNHSARHAIEKRFSGDSMKASRQSSVDCGGGGGKRTRKALLERNRTVSASSSDRVSLIGDGPNGSGAQRKRKDRASSVQLGASQIPVESNFGTVICTNSPPMHPRRAQLLQQYSDPQSLPTTTTTTTTTTTEDDTCSTLNTELLGGGPTSMEGGDCISLAGGSTTYTQHSSLNTIISFGRSSPLRETSALSSPGSETKPNKEEPKQQQHKQQLPQSRLHDEDDRCISSISDSVINCRQPLICMPSSLKALIQRGTGASSQTTQATTTRSATNLSFFETERMSCGDDNATDCKSPQGTSVMLELPLIRLPTEESSDSSMGSAELLNDGPTKANETRDPSIPGTSRKWSKETLF